jgi:FlgD Ig-like domain
MRTRGSTAVTLALVLACAGHVHAQALDGALWVTNGPIEALAADAGVVYIAGPFTQVGPCTGSFVVVDSTSGVVQTPTSTALATSWAPAPDAGVGPVKLIGGVLYLGGDFTQIGGQPRDHLAAFDDATGSITGWDPSANAAPSVIAACGAAVLVGGGFTTIGGQPRNRLAALDGTTGSATAWDPDVNGTVWGLACRGETVFAIGSFTMVGGEAHSRVAAIDAVSASPDSWDPLVGNEIFAVAADGDHVYLGGAFTNLGDSPRYYLAGFTLPPTAGVKPSGLEGRIDLMASPNPFSSRSTIRFSLAKSAEVELAVYDLNGRSVRTLRHGPMAAGLHALEWDGRDASGREAAHGIYFVRLIAGATSEMTKVVRLR